MSASDDSTVGEYVKEYVLIGQRGRWQCTICIGKGSSGVNYQAIRHMKSGHHRKAVLAKTKQSAAAAVAAATVAAAAAERDNATVSNPLTPARAVAAAALSSIASASSSAAAAAAGSVSEAKSNFPISIPLPPTALSSAAAAHLAVAPQANVSPFMLSPGVLRMVRVCSAARMNLICRYDAGCVSCVVLSRDRPLSSIRAIDWYVVACADALFHRWTDRESECTGGEAAGVHCRCRITRAETQFFVSDANNSKRCTECKHSIAFHPSGHNHSVVNGTSLSAGRTTLATVSDTIPTTLVLMEGASAECRQTQSKRYDKWKRKQARRVVIHHSVKFPKYEYDTNLYDPESPDVQCPVLHRFQTFLFETKRKGVQQLIDHFNRFLWHSASGEEITARQFFDFVVSERMRNSWLKLLDSTALTPSGRYNYIRPLPMALEWMSAIRGDGCAAMGDGVHLTVDQLHVLSLMRGEWDGIAKRVANEAQVFGAARNRVEDFKRRKEWAPIGRISEVAERVFNLLKKLMAVTSVRELTPYERSQYVDLLMLVMEFGRSCRPGSYAGCELECWSAEHHTVWSNGDITFRITNFKTRAKFLEDAGRVRAVHLPFVSYYVENIRPHFAAVYELAKANQKKLTDETRRTRNGGSSIKAGKRRAFVSIDELNKKHETGLFLHSNGRRYGDMSIMSVITTALLGRKISATRYRQVVATEGCSRLSKEAQEILGAADTHSQATVVKHYKKNSVAQNVLKAGNLIDGMMDDSRRELNGREGSSASSSSSSSSSAAAEAAAIPVPVTAAGALEDLCPIIKMSDDELMLLFGKVSLRLRSSKENTGGDGGGGGNESESSDSDADENEDDDTFTEALIGDDSPTQSAEAKSIDSESGAARSQSKDRATRVRRTPAKASQLASSSSSSATSVTAVSVAVSVSASASASASAIAAASVPISASAAAAGSSIRRKRKVIRIDDDDDANAASADSQIFVAATGACDDNDDAWRMEKEAEQESKGIISIPSPDPIAINTAVPPVSVLMQSQSHPTAQSSSLSSLSLLSQSPHSTVRVSASAASPASHAALHAAASITVPIVSPASSLAPSAAAVSSSPSSTAIASMRSPLSVQAGECGVQKQSFHVIESRIAQRINKYLIDRQSFFLTGAAGTGKSTILKKLVGELKSQGRDFAITASTGVAAITIGGSTINSWAGIGLGEGEAKELYGRMNERKKARVREVEILILDEISMISAKLFSTLDEVFRVGRPQHQSQPFGGVQLIISGDFLQLPPVEKTVHVQSLSAAGAADAMARAKRIGFAFQSPVWQSVIPRERVIELSTVYRQKDDTLVRILTEIRSGNCSRETERRIQQTANTKFGSIKPVKLTTHRGQADEINKQELDSLPGEPIPFDALDSGLYDSEKEACQAPTKLLLKVGAPVMLLKNYNDIGLCNGSQGVVVGFDDSGNPIVRFRTHKHKQLDDMIIKKEEWTFPRGKKEAEAKRIQYPLILAAAITIHKSQSLSLDWVEIKLEKSWSPAQVYSALSRARNFEGLRVTGFKSSLVVADKLVLEYYKNLRSASPPSTAQSPQLTASTALTASSGETATTTAAVAVVASSDDSRSTTVRMTDSAVVRLRSRKSESQPQFPPSVSIAGAGAGAGASAAASAGAARGVVSDIAVLDDILGPQTAMENTSSVDVKSSKSIPVASATSTSDAATKRVNLSRNQLRSALKSPNRRKPVNPDPATVPAIPLPPTEQVATIGNGVEVRASRLGPTAGLGLWATRPFQSGELITEYDGCVIDYKEAISRMNEKTDTHIRQLAGPLHCFIDGRHLPNERHRGGASFANDADQGARTRMTNSEFWTRHASAPNPGVNRAGAQTFDRVFLKATQLIKAGHEIYVDYGKTFWKRHSLT